MERVGVIGLGYVGLPVALAFARHFEGAVGFDIDVSRIDELKRGHDRTAEIDAEALRSSSLRLTCEAADLASCTVLVVTVPTPIDADRRPDLTPLASACDLLGPHLSRGSVVVFESTVYPGLTEEFCGPRLAAASGLVRGRDFKLAYSPERINPGDREHTLEKVVKIVAAEDEESLERVASLYGAFVEAGIHRAPSIAVAEAAKVIENTQRDLNIALMNELAIIFDRLEIRTKDVLEAAGTKWNFLPFTPGLVGGHCIGVDPYYLTARAEQVGHHPEVILAGRRINDGMGAFIGQKLVKLLVQAGRPVGEARVGIFGLTFKENVPDLRNSRVPDIVAELRELGISPLVHDPLADAEVASAHCGVTLSELGALTNLDAAILAVPHTAYLEALPELMASVVKGGVLLDVKARVPLDSIPPHLLAWSL